MVRISRKSSEERKKEIVEATLELIGEKGVVSLRTSEIAERVGFSEAALYKHFSTKGEVVKATIRTAGKELIGSLSTVACKAETENELEKLRRVLETHLSFINENPGMARLLFSDEVHFNQKDLRKELLNITKKYQDLVHGLLEKGIKKGIVREGLDVDAATTFYIGLVQSQVLFWSLSGGEKSLEEQVSELWNLYTDLVGVD